MATVNRSEPSEFGGRDGRIQKAEDGHILNAKEKAAIVRAYGMRNPSGEVGLSGEPWTEGVKRLEETRERVSGRDVEEGLA